MYNSRCDSIPLQHLSRKDNGEGTNTLKKEPAAQAFLNWGSRVDEKL